MDVEDDALRAQVRRTAKVELHIHLEGAIPLPTLWQLVRKYGGDPEVGSPEELAERFRYRDFPHFIETWVWKNQFLREYEDFTFIASEVARSLAAQGIVYAEVFYSPGDFRRRGLEPRRLTEAIRRGLGRVPEVEIALIVDLVRDFGPERGEAVLDAVAEVRTECGVIGVGIGGSEQSFPPEPFAPVYEKARRLGFRTTAHAGEAAGAGSVWGAIRSLRVDRIGHGSRAVEDPALVEYVAAHRIPIELCPGSNLRTGVASSLAAHPGRRPVALKARPGGPPALDVHPVRRYFDLGIPISINTDDPAMFATSLEEEYAALHREAGFTLAEIQALILGAVDCSWLDEERKCALRARIRSGLQQV